MTGPGEAGLRVVVLGGGIVGLACADRLVHDGHDVTVLDPTPGDGATWAAAGMLAPGGEAWFGEEPLLRLGLESLARWPAYATSLRERTGLDVDLRTHGTVLAGADRDDVDEVQRSLALVRSHGVRAEELDRRGLRRREPTLGPRVAGGAFLPDDHQVNPRRVTTALLRILGSRVRRVRGEPAADGVLVDDGSHLPADVVVLATGARGVPGVPHVRPVRGEIVRTRCPDPPRHVVRARVHGERVYVVPRADGEVVIGATEEEHATSGDPVPTVGGISRLLEAARLLLPGLDRAELLEVLARDRPGSPDNGPLIGPLPAGAGARLVIAGAHYRGGVLLAPITALAVAAHVAGREVPDVAQPFTPDRFDPDRPDTEETP